MRLLTTILGLLLLCSCSNADAGADAAKDKPKALPTVSTATTCGQLFDGDAPLEGIVDLMTKTTTPSDADRARDYASDLEPIEGQAGAELKPHIGVVADELQEFADTVDERGSYDTADMVTSLTELNNVCGVTPRF